MIKIQIAKLLDFGYSKELNPFTVRRIHLINAGLILNLFMSLSYLILSAITVNVVFSSIHLPYFVISLFLLYLSKIEKNTLAATLLVIIIGLLVVISSILIEGEVNMGYEYLMLLPFVFSFFAIENKKRVTLLSIWSLLIFVFIILSKKYNFFSPSIDKYHYLETTKLMLKIFIFIAIFLILRPYVSGSIKARQLLDQNILLLKEKQQYTKAEANLNSNKAALADIIENSLNTNLTINDFLQKALNNILNISWLAIKTHGAIFLKNKDGDLEMVAEHKMGDRRIKDCSLIKSGECLCGKALAQKKAIIGDYRSKFEQEAEQIPYLHFKKPLMNENEVVGLLNLYIDKEIVKNDLSV